MVYELGDENMKKELVDNLVSTLATGKAKKTTEAQRKDETCVGHQRGILLCSQLT